MKAITYTKTVEETIGWEANDGTRFANEDACRQYEQSAVCVAGEAVKKLTVKDVCAETAFGDFCVCYDDAVMVFDIKNAEDLNRINAFLRLESCDNPVVDPKYIGCKVAYRRYCDEHFGCLHGSRAEMELAFSKLMDKLFDEGNKTSV